MSSLNAARQHAEHSPHGIALDLVRYGIDVAVADVVMIDIPPIPQDKAGPRPTEGCGVMELPTEEAICVFRDRILVRDRAGPSSSAGVEEGG